LSDEGRSCVQEERDVTSIGAFLVVLFFLAAGGATKDGAFLSSEVELIRVGSILAYLAIN
jgi:energy-converting hydrogenase Eha subunit E